MTATGLRHKLNTKDTILCSKCDLKLSKWSIDENSLKFHLIECSLIQEVKKVKTSTWSKSLKIIFILESSPSSPSIQSELWLAADSEPQAKIKCSEHHTYDERLTTFTQEAVAVVTSLEPRPKVKSSKFLKSFKSEEFAVSPSSSSASVKSFSEPIIRSDAGSVKAEEDPIATQEAMKKEIMGAAAAAAIEAAKLDACSKNIDFFDPTMQIDLWEEFRISANSASFLYHLTESAVKYRKKSILKVLSRCLRGSALTWLKTQAFTSLNDFKKTFAAAFPPPLEPASSPDRAIIGLSPQKYHNCPKCSVQCSSILRLLAHTQRDCSKSFTCKHCEKAFASNNKLHEHVRLHHAASTSSRRHEPTCMPPTDPPSPPQTSVLLHSTPPATSESTSAILEPSHHSITMMKTPIACPSTSPPRTPILSHTLSKAYMTMNDLFEMFAEISSNKNKNTIQKRPTSPCSPKPRQPRTKLLCQRDPNTTMIAGKQSRKKWNIIHKRVRSSMPGQTQITSYFKPAGQSSKSVKFSPSEQEYIVVAGVDHTNKDIRVGMPLTNAKRYNSVKSSTNSAEKLKSSISSNRLSSAPRACSPANQVARTPQIVTDAISSLKSRPKPKALRTKSSSPSRQRYLADAVIDHTNQNIRVETPLTNAKKYESTKSLAKSDKLAKKTQIWRFPLTRQISQKAQIWRFPQQTQLGATDRLPSQSSRSNSVYCDRWSTKPRNSAKAQIWCFHQLPQFGTTDRLPSQSRLSNAANADLNAFANRPPSRPNPQDGLRPNSRALPNNGTSLPPPPPYAPRYSRRDDAERNREIVWRACTE